MDEEAVELDRKVEEKKEKDRVEGESDGECSNLLWLGEPMPASPKARTVTLFLFYSPTSGEDVLIILKHQHYLLMQASDPVWLNTFVHQYW